MNSEPDWTHAAQQFQQNMSDSWARALRSFGTPDVSLPGAPVIPQLSFSSDKLQALQEAYLKEAADLWNQGLGAKAPR